MQVLVQKRDLHCKYSTLKCNAQCSYLFENAIRRVAYCLKMQYAV